MATATSLFSKKGLKLGNYHYDVDRYENEEGKVEVYLNRLYEECDGCPLLDNGCDGEEIPLAALQTDKYPCRKMKPISPYSNGYEFTNGYDEVFKCSEFTDLEKRAIRMIWTHPKILERLN